MQLGTGCLPPRQPQDYEVCQQHDDVCAQNWSSGKLRWGSPRTRLGSKAMMWSSNTAVFGVEACLQLQPGSDPPPSPSSGKLSCRCTHQRAQVSAGVGKPLHRLGVCIWMHLVNNMGNSPSPGQPTPGVVKQDKSSRGSVDTTKTRSDPQGVRMSKGERQIGAAKGNQTKTMALCRPPPPSSSSAHLCSRRWALRYSVTIPSPETRSP